MLEQRLKRLLLHGTLLIYLLVEFLHVQAETLQCDYVHDRCVFIISTGRSGSTALMAALNQVDGIFIRGENNAMFQEVQSIHNLIQALSYTYRLGNASSLDIDKKYNVLVEKKRLAWHNNFPTNTADCLSKYIFKYLYGSGKFDNYIVGFKEIRFREHDKPVMVWNGRRPIETFYQSYVNSYKTFENRMNFLKTLCLQPQIMLNIRKNITATMHSNFYNSQQAHARSLPQLQEYIIRYHQQHPNDTLLVYYEDMYDRSVNATLARQVLQFLRIDTDAYNISFASVKPQRW
eukprot:TRINITY_DN4318_c0_g1_i1.p1 TRINITY_DN4318_c0_g1~~TRINITY_DN4318_c0_g1_i1.p1  ORF type:complete len:290 (+),score=6.40 TRINITY_DN4318_c0_g1_i1:131-1000(+)